MQTGTIRNGFVGFVCLVFGVLLSSPIFAAADRPLPKDGILGMFHPAAIPAIVIDDETIKLAAGAQIRDQKNLIVQTGAINGPDVHVLYQKNPQGQIQHMWILTDQEYQHISSGDTPLLPGVKAAPVQTD